jgi:threonine/homoserine/homoserine lactone efflux protein
LISIGRFLPFLVVATVLVVAPGPDFAMTTRNMFRGGRIPGVFTGLGVATGAGVWTAASVLGILTVVQVSAGAVEVLRVLGSLYLVWLGGRCLFSTWSRGRAIKPDRRGAEPVQSRRDNAVAPAEAFRQGLLCNLLNPKAAVIFTTVLPQFASTGRPLAPQLAELGAVFVLLIAVWLTAYSVLAAGLFATLSVRARRVVDAVIGVVLVGLGIRLALD